MISIHPSLQSIHIPVQAKVVFVTATVGFVLLGLVSRFLSRRPRNARERNARERDYKRTTGNRQMNLWRNLSSEPSQRCGSASPSGFRAHLRHGSVSSDRQSVISTVTTTLTPDGAIPTSGLTPQQLGAMGIEALETAIGYWEDALASYNPTSGQNHLALIDVEEGKFLHQLERILDEGYQLQIACNQLFLYETSVLFRGSTITSYSSVESFVSATGEIGDLGDFEENPSLDDLALYQSALKKLEEGAIPYRSCRTEVLKCHSDGDYVTKVHCVRMAFQYLLEKADTATWFINVGGQLLTDILLYADKDPKDCQAAYDEMIDFVQNKQNLAMMEEELLSRGVKCISVYDVVLDYILMDAFEDLDNPPSSVKAVVQNRWLSNGFKESALATAVWSVLQAKKRRIKHPRGFFQHFYSISEHLSPVLAWGFLGSNEDLNSMCLFFKEEVHGFMQDIFNVNIVHYTTVEELAQDILVAAQQRFDRTCQRMSL